MNRIVTYAQTCALVAVLFCVPHALAMKQPRTLPIEINPEAKNISKNILVGPVIVVREGRNGDSIGSSVLLNNELLAMAFNKKIKVWDLITGEKKYSLNHGDWICHNDSSPSKLADGSLVSIDNSTIKVWDLKNNSCKNEIRAVRYYPETIFDVLGVNENTIISSLDTSPPVIKIWDLGIKEGTPIKILNGHNKCISDLLKITDKYIASASYDKTVKVWSLGTGECILNLLGHEHEVVKLVKISDTCIASGDSNGNVKIWNLYTGKCKQILVGEKVWITHLIIASNRIIVGYLGGDMQIFDLSTGKLFMDLVGHTKTINDLIVVNDKTLISCSDDETIKIWDLNKGIWVQSINCGVCVRNIFMSMIQKVSTLVSVTRFGAIITCSCHIDAKDLKYFYKNLHEIIPGKKKNPHFEDLGINFN